MQEGKSMAGKNTRKALALCSAIGSIIKLCDSNNVKLMVLARQIDKAMQVYSRKDHMDYHKVIFEFKTVWYKLNETYMRTLKDNEPNKFIEYICFLMPESNFKAFLGTTRYIEPTKVSEECDRYLLESVLALELAVNEAFGTKPYVEPVRFKKTKIKKVRDKSKKKTKVAKVSSSKKKEGERRVAVRGFLKDRIAKAKEAQ